MTPGDSHKKINFWYLAYSFCFNTTYWNSRVNEGKMKCVFPILQTSAKSAQTSAVVCSDYSWSLQKVLRTYKFKCAYLLKCLRVLIIVSACTHYNEYVVLIEPIALCGTRCVIIDIQAPSFTWVNSLRLHSQHIAKATLCKAPQKDKFYLSFGRPSGRSPRKKSKVLNGLLRDKGWNQFNFDFSPYLI